MSPSDLTRFDFHVVRFMNSYDVEIMTDAEIGQFLLLLCKSWLLAHDATLPDDVEYLSRIARTTKVSERVLAKFPLVETEKYGRARRNATLFEEWEKASERSEIARERVNRRPDRNTPPTVLTAVPTTVLTAVPTTVLTAVEPQNDLSAYPYHTKPSRTNSTQSTQTDASGSEPVVSSSKKQQGDWKSIAIRHKNVFGKQASVKWKDKFYEACAQYGEDVVLECFDAWAEGAKTWVTSDQPLFLFFKNLNAEAENIVEINEAVQEEKTLAVQQKQREEQTQAASTERQCKENADRFAVKERVGVESVDDFLKG